MLDRILARLGHIPLARHNAEIAELRRLLAEADAQILRMQTREAKPGMIPVRGHYRKAKAGQFAANARLDDAG